MAVDIAPELLEKIQNEFESRYKSSSAIRTFLEKVEAGSASYADVDNFAVNVGKLLARAFRDNLSSSILPDGKMYFNIADRVVRLPMENNYDIITRIACQVQSSLNQRAGLGLKAVQPKLDNDRIDGIINRICSEEEYENVAWILDEPVVLFSQNAATDVEKANAEMHYRAGLTPKIIRKCERKCCTWCSQMAGTYTYPDVPADVYKRHERCRCTVEYDPADGKNRQQDVYSKRWTTEETSAKIAARQKAAKTSPPSVAEMMKRQKSGATDPLNGGFIAQKILDGEFSMKLSYPKYLQHKEGTAAYNNTLKTRGKAPSRLTITQDEAQELIYRFAGTGNNRSGYPSGYTNMEFVSVGKVIGQTQVAGTWIDTDRAQIIYGKNWAHIFPTNERSDNK